MEQFRGCLRLVVHVAVRGPALRYVAVRGPALHPGLHAGLVSWLVHLPGSQFGGDPLCVTLRQLHHKRVLSVATRSTTARPGHRRRRAARVSARWY